MIEILDKSHCCGCSACVQRCPKQCISLVEDKEGFLYPVVNKCDCLDCGLCEKVCPINNTVPIIEPIKILAAYNKNEEIRSESSSGGVFTVLAEKIINNGGVVFGAKFSESWEVVLDYTEAFEGLQAFRGSKYVQATVGDTYKKCEHFLKQGRQVLFSGTPCQIGGLKQFLSTDFSNLLTVDVVCHGVPSPMVWRKYLNELIDEQKTARRAVDGKSSVLSFLNSMSSIEDIKFRDKSDGWKKYRFVLTFAEASAEGKTSTVLSSITESHRDNVFMKAFLSDLILRPSCFSCPFRGTNLRQSDISIADYWGVQEVFPQMDDDKGISLAIVNTPKGLCNLSSEKLYTKATNFIEAMKWNGGLRESIPYNNRILHFYQSIRGSKHVIKQMEIHTLPEWQYKEAILPWYKKMYNVFKWKFHAFVSS